MTRYVQVDEVACEPQAEPEQSAAEGGKERSPSNNHSVEVDA